jgi:hypothetical protein
LFGNLSPGSSPCTALADKDTAKRVTKHGQRVLRRRLAGSRQRIRIIVDGFLQPLEGDTNISTGMALEVVGNPVIVRWWLRGCEITFRVLVANEYTAILDKIAW